MDLAPLFTVNVISMVGKAATIRCGFFVMAPVSRLGERSSPHESRRACLGGPRLEVLFSWTVSLLLEEIYATIPNGKQNNAVVVVDTPTIPHLFFTFLLSKRSDDPKKEVRTPNRKLPTPGTLSMVQYSR